jgi:hypothetical protein
MKKIVYVILFELIIFSVTIGQSKDLTKNMEKFKSSDWPTVLEAKEDLENLESEAIPGIIQLLDKSTKVKLTNTRNLIYPGMEGYVAYGQKVDYDIDKLNIRAGWLLEEITFQNFGFTRIHEREDMLLQYLEIYFPDYYIKNKVSLSKKGPDELRDIFTVQSIAAAKKWWEKNAADWNRLNGLREALFSDDEVQVVKALFYLRHGKTKCTGLDKKYYEFFLAERLMDLARGKIKRISENAKLIVLDYDFDWLNLKTAE